MKSKHILNQRKILTMTRIIIYNKKGFCLFLLNVDYYFKNTYL